MLQRLSLRIRRASQPWRRRCRQASTSFRTSFLEPKEQWYAAPVCASFLSSSHSTIHVAAMVLDLHLNLWRSESPSSIEPLPLSLRRGWLSGLVPIPALSPSPPPACSMTQVPGQLRVHPEGFVWRKLGGGKTVELSKADVSTLTWVKLPTGFQLSVRHRTGNKTKFLGFRPDVSATPP